MAVTIVGSQLGDEGKGGIVDLYCEDADMVARYQGGDNAGHTVVHEGEEYKLSLVPSGAVRGTVGVLGNGCVVNPRTLFDEIDALRERGLDPDVRVAQRAHVILPYHRVLDGAEEDVKSDAELDAGTTGRGIGPTYEDKIGRRGIRVGDLLDPEVLRSKLEYVVPQKRALAEAVYGIDPDAVDGPEGYAPGEAFDVDVLFEHYAAYGDRLRGEGMTVIAGEFIAECHHGGGKVLFEGAQGTGIDIDHGIFPYVTSSNPTSGYAATGTGVGATTVGRGEVIGVVKAYLSRVGTGPLPTEMTDDEADLADEIRERGGEFGTVTGRPRRIGWLDVPMLRHAARVNGFTGLAVNHLDVLAGLDELRVADAYELDGDRLETMPGTTEQWSECDPVYRTVDPWPEVDWAAVAEQGYGAIPEAARAYVEYLETELSARVVAVGVGPNRGETVVVEDPFDVAG